MIIWSFDTKKRLINKWQLQFYVLHGDLDVFSVMVKSLRT